MKTTEAIIFDLGGVILDIDYHKTAEAFVDLGVENFSVLYSQLRQDRLFDDFEKGLIDPQHFRERLRSHAPAYLSDQQIDKAWNAILIGLPKENVDILFRLKEKYRLFLLSNTNEIHERAFRQMIENRYGEYVFDRIFEKMYLSHRIHMRKPEPEIYKLVLRENELDPLKTVFVDDSPQNVEGGMNVGLNSILLEKGKKLQDLESAFIG
ncbi:MAG TPA: HAD family phosphatase [Bacteroidia bacterium]|nr:HAD family phosphatase [Bacteroidia bacterium]HNQ00380.1 HAD family phosphatase [Bacteroidia bacterium]